MLPPKKAESRRAPREVSHSSHDAYTVWTSTTTIEPYFPHPNILLTLPALSPSSSFPTEPLPTTSPLRAIIPLNDPSTTWRDFMRLFGLNLLFSGTRLIPSDYLQIWQPLKRQEDFAKKSRRELPLSGRFYWQGSGLRGNGEWRHPQSSYQFYIWPLDGTVVAFFSIIIVPRHVRAPVCVCVQEIYKNENRII